MSADTHSHTVSLAPPTPPTPPPDSAAPQQTTTHSDALELNSCSQPKRGKQTKKTFQKNSTIMDLLPLKQFIAFFFLILKYLEESQADPEEF